MWFSVLGVRREQGGFPNQLKGDQRCVVRLFEIPDPYQAKASHYVARVSDFDLVVHAAGDSCNETRVVRRWRACCDRLLNLAEESD